MIVNIHAAKTNLSKLIEKAEAGEEVVIARNGKPAVKLTPIGGLPEHPPAFEEPEAPAWFGSLRGQIWIAPGSEDPDEELTREMEDAVLRTIARLDGTPFPSTTRLASRWLLGRRPAIRNKTRDTDLETAYCAEVLAVTYQAMGLLPGRRDPGWFDAGRFWSGDNLGLCDGYRLGGEIAVHVPAGEPGAPALVSG